MTKKFQVPRLRKTVKFDVTDNIMGFMIKTDTKSFGASKAEEN